MNKKYLLGAIKKNDVGITKDYIVRNYLDYEIQISSIIFYDLVNFPPYFTTFITKYQLHSHKNGENMIPADVNKFTDRKKKIPQNFQLSLETIKYLFIL